MPVDFSIVIPTFRRQEPLRETLSSVLTQSDCTFEVIVVDDDAGQSARDLVEDLRDTRVRYVANPRPSGGYPSIPRNFGATFATGRFVHFLDDDDQVPDGLYRDAKAYFDRFSDVGVIFGRILPFGSDAAAVSEEQAFFREAARASLMLQRFGTRWPFATRMIFYRSLLVCGGALIRRECIAGADGFDPTIRYCEDIDFYARAMRRFGARFIDRTFLHYRISVASIAHAPGVAQGIADNFSKVHARFRREAGFAGYLASKVAAKTVLRVL